MHWTKQARSVAVLLAVAAGAGVGCGGSSAGSATAATATASAEGTPAGSQAGTDEEGDKLVEHHRHHHGGVAMFLSMSLDSLGLSDSERAAVTKIQSDLWTKIEPTHAAQHDVLALLADGVAAGSVDKAKVDAAVAQVDASAAAVQAATTDALNQLHAVLSPPERVALVQKLEAHWRVWQEANAEGDQPPADKKHGDRFASLTRDLNLTPDQIDHIRSALHAAPVDSAKKLDPAEVDGKLHAFGTAFTSETFDAKTVNGGEGANVSLPSHGIRRMARFYEAAAPVFTPDQRTKVAASLREHAGQESGK